MRSLFSTPALLLATVVAPTSEAFQNLIPKFPTFGAPGASAASKGTRGDPVLEEELLAAVGSQDGRLTNSDEIASIVRRLEEGGTTIVRPAIAPEVYGRWRLVHTTNADTASPIQRKAVDASKYEIYQNIELAEGSDDRLIVSQVVKFGPTNELRVDALASTSAYPLPELTAREGEGKILGLNILGVSLVGEEATPDADRPDSRIDFVFDEGKFDLFDGALKLPYPVPFRNPLFRDLVKGWIDVTYLSDRVRISRGNKGTTFVLVKEE